MLDLCESATSNNVNIGGNSNVTTPNSAMKHPKANLVTFEFNLGKALELRCVYNEKSTTCGECESCKLTEKLNLVKSWFPRLGDHSQRRFLLGLVRRFHSVDLLEYVGHILQPLSFKDFTYSRARTNPTLSIDRSTVSSDRALSKKDAEKFVVQIWEWFQTSNYWSKSNFTLAVLQLCDAHLLHCVGTQAKTLLASEEKAAMSSAQEYTESESIPSTEYTYMYHTEQRPELDLLAMVNPHYTRPATNPLTGEDMDVEAMIQNDDSGDESLTESFPSTIDPTFLVIPTSAKAHAGVTRYKDFIRFLPVHLAKCILSMLDKGSLYNALCVSKNWRHLVEEVHKEFFVNQQLWEEVMLMQGAASQGANPNYAKDVDVLVPNVNAQTWQTIMTDDAVIKPAFKSEINFETAFSGVSKRKVIMEERNVYCGAYNVMVLSDTDDSYRVVHTDGGKLIGLGSKDRKVRFLDAETGKETGPIISGHAGSIRCVCVCEDRKIVLSGSYDTSIRVWSMETGQCMKILRGHRDTVITVTVVGDTVASGAKDGSCKIWNIQTGKCLRSFRHKEPVGSIAMDTEKCITGCEAGNVKVWDLKTGQLIKRLSGHHGAVTGIKFDRWHIVTGSKDGYALAWSSQGDHARCLAALRHPKEVLCLEFKYLRVITGSADGRLRIWNMLTGQCCRIMRGNSRSDPILSIIAIGDRITLNTQVSLLVLNFEKVNWDYSMETDRVPPLVQYGKYSDAPVRTQPYTYIRAQRMQTAGAANQKIVRHAGKPDEVVDVRSDQHVFRAEQIAHSAKTLSTKNLTEARLIQSGLFYTNDFPEGYGYPEYLDEHDEAADLWVSPGMAAAARSESPAKAATISTVTRKLSKSRPTTSKSAPPLSVSLIDPKGNRGSRLGSSKTAAPYLRRRVSWAFEMPKVPKSKEISLSQTKALLRSQIRLKEEQKVPPDFIYMAVNMIQSTMKPSETNMNTVKNMQESTSRESREVHYDKGKWRKCRPSSSPSHIDPRTRVPIEELGLDKLRSAHFGSEYADGQSEGTDIRSVRTAKDSPPHPGALVPDKEVFKTGFAVSRVQSAPHMSLYGKNVPCSLPKGRIIRPHTSSLQRIVPAVGEELSARPATSIGLQRPVTHPSVTEIMPGAGPSQKAPLQLLSSASEANLVPMLMYSADVKKTISQLKGKRESRKVLRSASEPAVGRVSSFNDPLRNHIKFELKTYEQEKQILESIGDSIKMRQIREIEELERKRKTLWLSKVKGKHHRKVGQKPISVAL